MTSKRHLPSRDFAVVPPGKWAWITGIGLAVLMPAIALAGVALSQRSEALLPVLCVTGVLMLAVALFLFACMRRRKVSLEDGMLVVRATLYTLRISAKELDLGGARIMDLREHREYLPMIKSNGFGLPGFWAGHFRSKRFGKQFVLLTDRSRVLLLPQHSGRHILLSLEHPEALLKILKAEQD